MPGIGISIGFEVSLSDGAGDFVAPTLSSAVINTAGTTLTLTYNEALDTGSTPAAGAFTLNGTAITVASVNVTGSTVVLTLSSVMGVDVSVTLDYTAGASPIQDAAGNDAANLSGQAVTNNSTQDVTAPTLSTIATNTAGTTITLTYNEALDTGSTPATTAYSLSGTSSTVSSVQVTGSTVVLTLNTATFFDQTITLSYTAPGSGKVRDVAANNVANLSNSAVTNNTIARALDILSRVTSVTINEFLIGDAGVTVTGSGVSTWANQAASGATGNATQGTDAARPTYNASELNSKGVLTFDSSAQTMLFASLDVPAPGTTPSWFCFVLRQSTWTSGDRIYSSSGSTTFSIRQAGVSPEISVNNGVAGPVNAGAPINTWTRVQVLLNNSTTDYIKAGSAAASTGTNTGNGNPTSGTTALGSNGAGAGFWGGKMAIVLRTAGEPNAGEKTFIDAWIASYYGGLVTV